MINRILKNRTINNLSQGFQGRFGSCCSITTRAKAQDRLAWVWVMIQEAVNRMTVEMIIRVPRIIRFDVLAESVVLVIRRGYLCLLDWHGKGLAKITTILGLLPLRGKFSRQRIQMFSTSSPGPNGKYNQRTCCRSRWGSVEYVSTAEDLPRCA